MTQVKKRSYDKIGFAHRRLFVDAHQNYLRGEDVKAIQRAINAHGKSRGFAPLKVDGVCGRATIATGRRVATALGIGLKRPGLTVYVQHLIRHPRLRTKAQVARGKKWWEDHHKPVGPTVSGNVVTGGSDRARAIAAAHKACELSASGARHSFYSQAGTWTVNYGITGEPHGYRSDCSQWFTSMYHSAGLPDPNKNGYSGGYTGTLGTGGKYITRAELKPGDAVLYGPAPHHHVEMYVGPGNRTIGHGSPPVDYGDIYMIADPHFATYLP